MKSFIPPTSDPKNETHKSAFWTSNSAWDLNRKPGKPIPHGTGNWPDMMKNYVSTVPTVFLANVQYLSQINHKGGRWLVRDGLIPLLSFFSRFPKPLENFRSILLIHADCVKFIPKKWLPYCASYVIGSRDTYEFLETMPLSRRTRWVTAAYLSEEFCSIERLRDILIEIKSKSSLSKVRRIGPIMGILDVDPGSPAYAYQFCSLFSSVLKGEFTRTTAHDMAATMDLRDAIFIDLNERLFCADDAFLHLFLSKGAIRYQATPPSSSAEFIRLSPFHGIFVSTLPRDIKDIWDQRELKSLKVFLETARIDARNPSLAYSDLPHWLRSFATVRKHFIQSATSP